MALHKDVVELSFNSTLDGSRQHALWYRSSRTLPAPLVVGLHTWSYDRFNQLEHMLPHCQQRGWSLLLPEFRGPNLDSNPRAREACASPSARQDVLDAIGLVSREYRPGNDGLFLLGGSGGGHMALMLAAHTPDLWSGVSAWVPITGLADWHRENPDYSRHIEACCGGAPGEGDEVDEQYRLRSPLNYLDELSRVKLSVHHGRHDDVVSYRHTMNLMAGLEMRDASGFFFEIFDGGHEIRYQTAFDWFDRLSADDDAHELRLTG
ncbi:MAG TPA: prolyl oligopeptidase family serine peptidase [Geomonas sp.]|nr:prolyl oligopeptidase family serine peptidase [Geomonas sp.]